MKSTFVFAVALAVLAACSSSSSNSSTEGGTSGEGGGGGLSCDTYCAAIMANCTSTTPADGGNPVGNQQYTDMNNCMNSCKAFPVGTASDMMGNTLGCRIYHASLAKSDPVMHCPHAGPGGDGTCGSNCEGFCQLAQMYCTPANEAGVFMSLSDCMSQCGMFPDTTKFNIGVQDGSSTACLLYHAQEASSAPPDHCIGDIIKDDAGDKSTTCH